jgi:hypothetical protein
MRKLAIGPAGKPYKISQLNLLHTTQAAEEYRAVVDKRCGRIVFSDIFPSLQYTFNNRCDSVHCHYDTLAKTSQSTCQRTLLVHILLPYLASCYVVARSLKISRMQNFFREALRHALFNHQYKIQIMNCCRYYLLNIIPSVFKV